VHFFSGIGGKSLFDAVIQAYGSLQARSMTCTLTIAAATQTSHNLYSTEVVSPVSSKHPWPLTMEAFVGNVIMMGTNFNITSEEHCIFWSKLKVGRLEGLVKVFVDFDGLYNSFLGVRKAT